MFEIKKKRTCCSMIEDSNYFF